MRYDRRPLTDLANAAARYLKPCLGRIIKKDSPLALNRYLTCAEAYRAAVYSEVCTDKIQADARKLCPSRKSDRVMRHKRTTELYVRWKVKRLACADAEKAYLRAGGE